MPVEVKVPMPPLDEIEDPVAVAVEGQFAAQIGLIGGLEAAGQIALIEIDRGARGAAEATAATAASAAAGRRHKAAHARIRARKSAMLVAHQLGVEAVERNAQIVIYEERLWRVR